MIRTVQALFRCKRGNAMIIVATTMPLLIGASAVGVDTIQVTLAKRQLQRSADSAALAGVHAVLQIPGINAATAAVDRDLQHNNGMTLAAPRVVENAPTTGAEVGNQRAVRVALTARRAVPFMSFFTSSDVTISVEATAAAFPDGNYCVVSLEAGSQTGIEFGGGSRFDFGCGLATNSTGSPAIYAHGGNQVVGSPIAARGSAPTYSNYSADTLVISNAPQQPDPYASIPDPVVPPDCDPAVSINASGNHTLGPGCFRGMDLKKGNITLLPGTYIVDGGTLSFGSQVKVTGNGVTFVLTSRNATGNPGSVAGIDTSGDAQINLTAPTEGPYAGLIIFQDRRALNQDPKINGGAGSVIDGAIYMPRQSLTFNGGAGVDVRCMRLVTLRVKFTGTADITNNCPTTRPNRGFDGWTVRLVG